MSNATNRKYIRTQFEGVFYRPSPKRDPKNPLDIARRVLRPETIRQSQVGRVCGAKAKYADNIAAIQLLNELREQNAMAAGPDDKKSLVRYVGWGGIPRRPPNVSSHCRVKALPSAADAGPGRHIHSADFLPK
jgi:hypothetical protein